MKHKCLFRKIVATFLVIATMLPAFACTPRQQVEATPQPSVAIETPEPDLNPYKGDGSKYVSIYTNERDKACEADVVKFADCFLNPYHGHPKLIDADTTVRTYVTPFAYEEQLKNFFNPALRAEFLKRMNELILSIPDLTDFEIIAGLAETAALLKDGHSWVYLPMEKQFPLELLLFPNETGVELYVNGTTADYEECLTARLDAINGVSINEIIERTKPFESYEAEQLLYNQTRKNAINWNFLNHIGVVDDSGSAIYSFTDASGNSFDKEIHAVDSQNKEDIKMTRYLAELTDPYEDDSLIHMYDTDNFEYRYLKEDTVLYLRINSLWIDDGRDDGIKRIYDMFNKIGDENKPIESIIVDYRQNGGGRADLASAFIAQLNNYDDSIKKYILISEVTYSAGIVTATCLRRGVSNAILVGSPGGAPANGMFNAIKGRTNNNNWLELPNLNTYYGAVTSLAYDCWPGYKEYTLMPDEVIYQTYEDYLNGVDTVMKALLSE